MARGFGRSGQRPSGARTAQGHHRGDPRRSPGEHGVDGHRTVVPAPEDDPLPRLRDPRAVAGDLGQHAGAVRRTHRPDVRQDDEDPDVTSKHAADGFLAPRSGYRGQGTASMTGMYVAPCCLAPQYRWWSRGSGPRLLPLRVTRRRVAGRITGRIAPRITGLGGAFLLRGCRGGALQRRAPGQHVLQLEPPEPLETGRGELLLRPELVEGGVEGSTDEHGDGEQVEPEQHGDRRWAGPVDGGRALRRPDEDQTERRRAEHPAEHG